MRKRGIEGGPINEEHSCAAFGVGPIGVENKNRKTEEHTKKHEETSKEKTKSRKRNTRKKKGPKTRTKKEKPRRERVRM